jgi:hypothetical protein
MRSLVLIFFLPFSYGWGKEVHYIIADIAGNLLPDWHARYIEDLFQYTPKGQKPIAELLASISADPDKKIHPYIEYQYYHYAHATPSFETPWNYETMCGHRMNPDQCIVRGIAIFSAMAGDIDKKDAERAFAIEMLVHLMADIHQPLHLGLWSDFGGHKIWNVWNSYDPFFSKNPKIKSHTHYNLHELWDKGLFRFYEENILTMTQNKENHDPNKIHDQMEGWRILAESLRTEITEGLKANMEYPNMDITDVTIESEAQVFAAWIADESIKLAEKFAYKDENGKWIKEIQGSPRVSLEYMRTRFEIMKRLLIKAGYRLARLLEKIVEYSHGKEVDEVLSIIQNAIYEYSNVEKTDIQRKTKPELESIPFNGKQLFDKTNFPQVWRQGMMESEQEE